MKSRVAEELNSVADKNRDRKGKTIANEEFPTEIFEIEDDPADADPWCESHRKYIAQGNVAGARNQQAKGDQPASSEERVRRYGRKRNVKGSGNRAAAGGMRGRR